MRWQYEDSIRGQYEDNMRGQYEDSMKTEWGDSMRRQYEDRMRRQFEETVWRQYEGTVWGQYEGTVWGDSMKTVWGHYEGTVWRQFEETVAGLVWAVKTSETRPLIKQIKQNLVSEVVDHIRSVSESQCPPRGTNRPVEPCSKRRKIYMFFTIYIINIIFNIYYYLF